MNALLGLLLACLCWGISFPLVRALSLDQAQAVPEASTWCLTSWGLVLRFALAAVVLGWWCRASLVRMTWAEWSQATGLGLFTAGGMLLQMDSLSYANASTVAFLTQCYVVWIPLLAALRSRIPPSLRTALCIAMVLVGVGILAGVDPLNFSLGRGELEAIGSSALFTGQILWAERPIYAANRPQAVGVLSFAISALAFVPVVACTAPSVEVLVRLYADPWRIALLVVLAVVSTGIGMLLMFRWQRFVGATAAAVVYCTEPIWASLTAFIVPGLLSLALGIDYGNEKLTTALLLGGSLIILANLAMQWRPDRRGS